jgi:hypothetical protein
VRRRRSLASPPPPASSHASSHASRQLVAAPNPARAPAPARVRLASRSAEVFRHVVVPVSPPGGVPTSSEEDTVDAVLVDDATAAPDTGGARTGTPTARIPVHLRVGDLPVIDERVVNPSGWRRDTGPELGLLLGHVGHTAWEEVRRISSRYGSHRVLLLVPAPWGRLAVEGVQERRLPEDPGERARILHQLRGVVDTAGLHWTQPDRARWLVEVAARGVPVLATDLDQLATRLAVPLAAALDGADVAVLDDPEARERFSIQLRNAALRHHGATAVWRELARDHGLPSGSPPSVSVLLATNRPEAVPAAVRRVACQRHPRTELILALHGDGWPTELERQLREQVPFPLQILRVPSDRVLGEVLAAATERASGELLAKMDDDDLYGPDHLTDLVDAMRYSGATVVGKGSEYVYLEELDTTIRRFPTGAESANRNLAGGTLLVGRDALRQVGGWQRARRAVDQRLLDDVIRAGGTLHRTHGRGFLLMRTGGRHTWDVPVDYFLRQAVAQWRGLAADVAGVA